MVVYGDQKHSAMAKTVGLPAAIATRMLLERMLFIKTNDLKIQCFFR
jgi:saccharopine dehydrogenase-like NADP-dependent oxidoreductase